MKIAIRRMGNSQGVIIPKPVLAQAGLEAEFTAVRGDLATGSVDSRRYAAFLSTGTQCGPQSRHEAVYRVAVVQRY